MMKNLKLVWSKTNRWHRVGLIFLLVELKLIPGGQLGFQCNDPALSHPYTGDTINWKWLIGITLFFPFAVMLIVEKYRDKTELAKRKALKWYKEYLFGFLINITFVQCLKFIVGSPRPHFFDTCSPKEALTCEASEYVSSYTCTKAHWLNQSDKSFPSGHTSLAFHAGIFITYYLYLRAKQQSRVIQTLQLICILSCIYCGISRMTDHRHHWWDVLAGFIISGPILVYTMYLCKNFEYYTPKNVNEDQKEENIQSNESKENDIQLLK